MFAEQNANGKPEGFAVAGAGSAVPCGIKYATPFVPGSFAGKARF